MPQGMRMPLPPIDPLRLLDDYNEYLVRTHHWQKLPHASRRRVTPANLEVMRKLAEWCATNEVEPRLWLYSLFNVRHWTYAPPFKQLQSKKHLERFKGQKREGGTYFSNRVQKEMNEQQVLCGDSYDPNRDVSGSVENLKRHYLALNAPQVCMNEMSKTLGFHPRSQVCSGCPLAQPCAARLQSQVAFDIQALRRGEITAGNARAQAILHGSRT